MPNRIIKESIRTSETIDKLSTFEETLFYRLIVSCDDYGRFDGRSSIVKGSCFPLKDNITRKNIEDALDKLASVGLVSLYEVDGKPFLLLPSWSKHQNIRAKKSKYPEPNKDMNASVCKCMQMNANVPVIQSNPIQSESNPNPNPNPIEDSEDKLTAMAKQVIDHLNERTGSHYKYSASSMKGIKARLEDNFTVEDCFTVIDKKSDEWIDDPKMAQFLRPITLFRPSNFESYLNQPIVKKKRSSSNAKIELPEYMKKPIQEGKKASEEEIKELQKMQREMKERHKSNNDKR